MRCVHSLATAISLMILALVMVAQTSPPSPPPGETPPAPAQPTQPPVPNLQDKLDRFAEVVADTIARSHGAENWRQKTAVQADVVIAMNGQPAVNGVLTHEVNRGRTRFEVKDGLKIVFDGESLWLTPSSADMTAAEFHGRLMSWLLAAPFRLRDRTVQPSAYRVSPVNLVRKDSFRLTFTSHAGAMAGEWRLIYSDPKSHLLHAVANVPLTAAMTGDAHSSRQCIVFDEYKLIDGVSLASRWTIWNWDNEVQGEPIGTITLSEIRYTVPPGDAFDKPSDAKEITQKESSPKPGDAAGGTATP